LVSVAVSQALQQALDDLQVQLAQQREAEKRAKVIIFWSDCFARVFRSFSLFAFRSQEAEVAAKAAETIKSFRGIVDGKHDDLPEQAFYMVGGIEEAVEKARRLRE